MSRFGGDQVLDILGIPPGEPVELALRELSRVHLHPTLGPSVGKVNQGCFPGHQGRQATHLFEVGLKVVAGSPL